MVLTKLISRSTIIKVCLRTIHTTDLCKTRLKYSPNAKLAKGILDRYLCLPQPECLVTVEYVFIDGSGELVCSKLRTLEYTPSNYKEVPNWSCDGAMVGLAKPENADVTLVPVALYNDPMRRGNNKLVLCETFSSDSKPTCTNHRSNTMVTSNKSCKDAPCFSFSQDLVLLDVDNRPFGWPSAMGEPTRCLRYHSGVGGTRVHGRDIMEAFYRACLYAGVQLISLTAEVLPAMWTFQTGPSVGCKAGDDLWMARFLVRRLAEEFGLNVCMHSSPECPGLPGNALLVEFATKCMREDNGLAAIKKAIEKLKGRHKDYLEICGTGNETRLNGSYGTSRASAFTTGIGRCCSVRIPAEVERAKKGHFEDRRPGANADPYRIMDAMITTVCLCDGKN